MSDEWVPTCHLKIFVRRVPGERMTAVLKQLWICANGATEWRPILIEEMP